MAVLPTLPAQLLGVGVSLGAAQGCAMPRPSGVQGGAWEWVAPLLLLPALQLGRGDAGVAPPLGEAPLGGGGVRDGEGLVAVVGRLIGLGRREVEQLPQRPQRLTLGRGTMTQNHVRTHSRTTLEPNAEPC